MSKGKKVVDFKKYLSKDNPLTGKLYFGPFNHEIDEGFKQAVKGIEGKIASVIDNKSIIGHLWTKEGFNYNASVEDLHNSLVLITNAQANLDALDAQMENGQNDIQQEFRFMNTPDSYLEEPYSDQSQKEDLSTLNLPDMNMDDRIIEMLELMSIEK